jgi:uncharacterized protein (TIGR02996 family)
VTTEDDFQSALDANPVDWQTRLVFADWLQERSDPRAEGYRALGVLRKRPFVCGFDNKPKRAWVGVAWFARVGKGDRPEFGLPKDWFDAVEGLGDDPRYRPRYFDESGPLPNSQRRAIEDAITLAFSKLPPRRRATLLAVAAPRKRRAAAKPKQAATPKRTTRARQTAAPKRAAAPKRTAAPKQARSKPRGKKPK